MSYNNETKENKIWTKDKIDFYAQIRRNVDKESVNFKRHLFLNIAWRTFGQQLIINF